MVVGGVRVTVLQSLAMRHDGLEETLKREKKKMYLLINATRNNKNPLKPTDSSSS